MIKNVMLFVIVICFVVFYFSVKNFYPENLIIKDNIENILITDKDNKQIDIGTVCSLSNINVNYIVFCNYANLFIMNKKTGLTKFLNKPDIVEKWCPTGLKWCNHTKILYVANYKGSDILSFKFDKENNLVLHQRYVDADIIGPENIDISKDGSSFVVADFDSEKVVFFKNGIKAFSQKVPRIHGISFSNDEKFIIATGLYPSKLYKLDLLGNLLVETGKPEWGEDGYLWPTSVSKFNKTLLVSDAHTGKITFLDDMLNPLNSMSGNGLGIDLFNMPYSLELINEKVLFVTDTFKGRILKINVNNKEILSIYQATTPFESNKLIETENMKGFKYNSKKYNKVLLKNKPLGLNYANRCDLTNVYLLDLNLPVNFIPDEWSNFYNGFKNKNGKYLYLYGSSFLFSSSIYYWTFMKNYSYKGKRYTIIGSPQTKEWLIVYDGIVVPVQIGIDFWFKNDKLISTKGEVVSFKELVKKGHQKIKSYKHLIKNGELPLNAMKHIFGNQDFEGNFKLTFQSNEGRVLSEVLLLSQSMEYKKAAILEYLEKIKDSNIFYFFELAICSMFLK